MVADGVEVRVDPGTSNVLITAVMPSRLDAAAVANQIAGYTVEKTETDNLVYGDLVAPAEGADTVSTVNRGGLTLGLVVLAAALGLAATAVPDTLDVRRLRSTDRRRTDVRPPGEGSQPVARRRPGGRRRATGRHSTRVTDLPVRSGAAATTGSPGWSLGSPPTLVPAEAGTGPVEDDVVPTAAPVPVPVPVAEPTPAEPTPAEPPADPPPAEAAAPAEHPGPEPEPAANREPTPAAARTTAGKAVRKPTAGSRRSPAGAAAAKRTRARTGSADPDGPSATPRPRRS